MKLLLARHGQSEWQVRGDDAGEDAPLSSLGELQAHRLGAFLVAANPLRNRDIVLALLVTSALTIATYVYLIQTGAFPAGEYLNVGVLGANALALGLLYPWKQARAQTATPD